MVNDLPVKAGDVGSIPQEDPLEKENGNPLQYSCLGNPMGRGAWQATVHRVAKSWAWLVGWACTQQVPNNYIETSFPSNNSNQPLNHLKLAKTFLSIECKTSPQFFYWTCLTPLLSKIRLFGSWMEPVNLLEVNDIPWWFLEQGCAQRRSSLSICQWDVEWISGTSQ